MPDLLADADQGVSADLLAELRTGLDEVLADLFAEAREHDLH
ncbi:hypothetical protein [Nonomuraea cypriaca]|nr:hypothetical protein [Nonomuraea cypriaca]